MSGVAPWHSADWDALIDADYNERLHRLRLADIDPDRARELDLDLREQEERES